MNICPISIPKFNLIKCDQKIPAQKFNYELKADTVSFSGKNKKTPNMQSHDKIGTQFGREFYSMLNENYTVPEILEKLNKTETDLTIKDIEELRALSINPIYYRAFFNSKLKGDFIPKDMQLYLRLNEKLETNTDKLLFAMDVAHEYTHYSQTKSGDYYNTISEIADGDTEYGMVLAAIGDHVFTIFDTQINNSFAYSVLKNSKFNKNGIAIPEEAYINKQQIMNQMGMKNEAAFKKYLKGSFDAGYIETCKTIINNPEMADETMARVFNKLSKTPNGFDKLMSDVKKYCSLQAKREKEARKAESNLAKKILKSSGTINYDVFPLYYEILEEALNN